MSRTADERRHRTSRRARRTGGRRSPREHHLSALLALEDVGLVCLDAARRITLFNAGAERIFGHPAREMLHRPFDVLFAPEHRGVLHHRIDALERDRSPAPTALDGVTIRGLRRGGEEVEVEVSLSGDRTDGDDAVFTLAVRERAGGDPWRAGGDGGASVERARFMSRASDILASSLDYEATLESVARLAVPRLADWCVIDLVEPDGEVRRVVVVHRDERKEELARRLGDRFPPGVESPHPSADALRTGEPQFLREVDDEVLERSTADDEHRELVERLGTRSTIAVPLVARGHLLGALSVVVGDSGRRFDEDDFLLVRELGRRAAVAIDNARLYAASEEAERRMRGILESISDAFFAVDREWRFTYVNERCRELTERLPGEGPRELLGRTLWEAVPEVRGTPFEERYRRVMETGEDLHFEERFASWDTWLEVHAYPSADGLSVYFRDVTSRKVAERERDRLIRELDFERSRLETVFEQSPAFMAVLRGPEHVFEMANEPYHRLVGDRDLVGRSVREVFPELEGERYFELLDRVYETGEPYVGREDRVQIRRGPGEPLEDVYLNFVYQPLVERDGSVAGVLAQGYEVTDQVRARERLERRQRELEEARARSEFLSEASRVLNRSLDYEETLGNVASLAVPEVADWCAIDLVEGDGLRRVAIEHADPDRARLARRLLERYPPDPDSPRGPARAIRTGEPEVTAELDDELLDQIARSEGHRRVLGRLDLASYLSVPLVVHDDVLGAITLAYAESGRRYDDEALAFAREFADRAAVAVENARLYRQAGEREAELEKVLESRSRLMRGFTHDVKNPLGAAQSHARLLEEEEIAGRLSERQRDSVARIRRSLGSAMELIDDVFELSRAEEGRIRIERRPVDLAELAEEVIREHRLEAEEKGLELSIETGRDPSPVRTDPSRVRQVLGNLVSNAVKFTSGGAVEVRLERRPEGPGDVGPATAVSVRDTGPGISREDQDRLFQEFSRVGAEAESGTGLGLAISRRIARLLGGELTVESTPGEGSTFTLWLPVGGRPDPH